jgi:glutamate racemase
MRTLTAIVLILALIMPNRLHAQDTLMPALESMLDKDTVTILVTDSGLGGLAVAADVEHRVRTARTYHNVRVVFCNALAEKNYGYNSMATREEKINVFSSALTGMVKWYRPDIILIACNTLSVLYAETAFAKTAPIPVVGIVDCGVDLMAERLKADSTSVAIILGTPTTIAAAKHREGLIAKGVTPDRIVMQACRNLESEIQTNPSSSATRALVDTYIGEALAAPAAASGKNIVAGFCCTHYGYSRDLIEEALHRSTTANVTIVDPNARMADFLFPKEKEGRFTEATCTVSVVSRTVVTEEEKESLGGLLERVSPAAATALRSFTLKRDLFEFTPSADRR